VRDGASSPRAVARCDLKILRNAPQWVLSDGGIDAGSNAESMSIDDRTNA